MVFSYPSCLWRYLRICTSTLYDLSQRYSQCTPLCCLCLQVAGVLLWLVLPLSLVLLPGAPGWWCPHCFRGHLAVGTTTAEEWWGLARVLTAFTASGVVWFAGTTTVGAGLESQALPWLKGLPSSLWLWVPLPLGGQSHVHYLCCCYYWVPWGCELSHFGEETRIVSTASTVPLVLPPLCVPIHSISGIQMCGCLWHSGMLSRETFVELWMFY